jgi:hypothetical protein
VKCDQGTVVDVVSLALDLLPFAGIAFLWFRWSDWDGNPDEHQTDDEQDREKDIRLLQA